MKLTIEPRKTTWVKFLDSKAQLKIEWRCRVDYNAYNVKEALTWGTKSRYLFSSLSGVQAVPSAQLLLLEQGVPLAITQTVVSAVKDKFQSEEIDDPFVVVTDKLASLKKSERKERSLGKGLLERTWLENIERSISIENKTGKKVSLFLTLVDRPADDLSFVQSEPAPTRKASPEYVFELELAPDEEKLLKISLRLGRTESIRLQTEPARQMMPTRASNLNAPAFERNIDEAPLNDEDDWHEDSKE